MLRFSVIAAAVLLSRLPTIQAGETSTPIVFETDVRPIFKAFCFECHGEGESLRSGLDLRLKRLAEKGGKSGPGIVPHKPGESLLVRKIRNAEMPPGKKKLTPQEVAIIEKWVAEGARVARPEPEKLASGIQFTDDDRAYWAFQPVRKPTVPSADSSGRARSEIDAFIASRLKKDKLAFAPDADKATLIRRATIDLTGLPPTPDEVEVFLRDTGADAYEKLLDRLLASPRYGERWGRHWLDVAGYADSDGFSEHDPVRPEAYRYRDYVIKSFNADKPFDQFIREQIAGDEMIRPPFANLTAEATEKLIATGFLRMAPDGTGSPGVDLKIAKNQVLSDTIKIVSSSLLGLTVQCAQCHNHRYDPISQMDYYRLRAILEPAYNVANWRAPAARRISLYTDADRQKAAEIEKEALRIDQERTKKQKEFIEATFQKELAKLPEAMRDKAKSARNTPADKRNADQKKLMQEFPSLNVDGGSLYLYDHKAADELKKMAGSAKAVREKKPVEEFISALTETPGQIPTTFLFNRGDPEQPKQPVAAGGLTILEGVDPLNAETPKGFPTSGRRLAFAKWLTDGKHPLTSRVLVNRVWLNHFGRGIVPTPGDFGRLGEKPTYPELLDWLASCFVADGWSMKKLHKRIMTSTVYRQSSKRDASKDTIDPDNRLLSRFPLLRLDAEGVRDSILAVTGKLNLKAFGPPVPVKEDEVGQIVVGMTQTDGNGIKQDVPLPGGEGFRRSVYVQVRRSKPLAVLDTFDSASVEPNCEARKSSTVTPQALLLLNSDFIARQAEFFAERIRKEAGSDINAQITLAWKLAYQQPPAQTDLREALAFLDIATASFKANVPKDVPDKKGKVAPPSAPALQAMASFCQALLCSNRFLYVD